MEEFLNRHRKTLQRLRLETQYDPCGEQTGLAELLELTTNAVDKRTRFAGFLSELAKIWWMERN